jgi:hypothetical protein
MNDHSVALGPGERLLEPVVAPEQLLSDQERGSAEEPACLRFSGLLPQAILDGRLLDAGENLLRIKT